MNNLIFTSKHGTSRIKKLKAKRPTTKTLKRGFRESLRTGLEMRQAVKLPNGEDRNEWIAMNTIEQFNTLTMVYDIIADFCTVKSCPLMSAASPKGEAIFLWQDDPTKKPTEVPAPTYISLLFKWVTDKISDESLFPTSGDFPKHFISEIKVIMKRMLRVYAHIYYKHRDKVKELNAESHLNTCFRHFYFFAQEFKLVKESEFECLQSYISS
jgi:hypothetical protein